MKQEKQAIWKAHVHEWEQSGLSQRRFCEERGLALSTFQWWRARLKKTGGQSSASMVRVAVGVAEAPSDLVVEVGAFKVTVRGTVDRELLGGVLDVLENR